MCACVCLTMMSPFRRNKETYALVLFGNSVQNLLSILLSLCLVFCPFRCCCPHLQLRTSLIPYPLDHSFACTDQARPLGYFHCMMPQAQHLLFALALSSQLLLQWPQLSCLPQACFAIASEDFEGLFQI